MNTAAERDMTVVRSAYIQFVWIIELARVAVGGIQRGIEALPLTDRP
jgi:hypothetical protein